MCRLFYELIKIVGKNQLIYSISWCGTLHVAVKIAVNDDIAYRGGSKIIKRLLNKVPVVVAS